MPTYQYACTECDYRFEAVQAFSDPSLTECPQCHGKLRKVYGSVGVVFKGSGFYRTDSRSGSGQSSLTPDHKSDKSSDSTPGSSSSNGTSNGSANGAATSSSSGASGSKASSSGTSSSAAKTPAAAAN